MISLEWIAGAFLRAEKILILMFSATDNGSDTIHYSTHTMLDSWRLDLSVLDSVRIDSTTDKKCIPTINDACADLFSCL